MPPDWVNWRDGLSDDRDLRDAQLRYIRDDIVFRRIAFALACALALVGIALMILGQSTAGLLAGAGSTAIGLPMAYYFGRRRKSP